MVLTSDKMLWYSFINNSENHSVKEGEKGKRSKKKSIQRQAGGFMSESKGTDDQKCALLPIGVIVSLKLKHERGFNHGA